MPYLRYTATNGMEYGFDMRVEEGRYQVYILAGPAYPADLVPTSEVPPGCEHHNGNYRINWFSLTRITTFAQAQILAAGWAEDTIKFLQSRKWVIPYTTNSGKSRFRFSIEKTGASRKVYILEQPGYGNRPHDSHSTHRLGSTPKYICWEGEITTWSAAEQIACRWAECTEQYIKTGQRF